MGPHGVRGSHSGNGNQVKNCSRDAKGREGEVEKVELVQGVRSETEDNEGKDIGHP